MTEKEICGEVGALEILSQAEVITTKSVTMTCVAILGAANRACGVRTPLEAVAGLPRFSSAIAI